MEPMATTAAGPPVELDRNLLSGQVFEPSPPKQPGGSTRLGFASFFGG
jgi:hypothetical protein